MAARSWRPATTQAWRLFVTADRRVSTASIRSLPIRTRLFTTSWAGLGPVAALD